MYYHESENLSLGSDTENDDRICPPSDNDKLFAQDQWIPFLQFIHKIKFLEFSCFALYMNTNIDDNCRKNTTICLFKCESHIPRNAIRLFTNLIRHIRGRNDQSMPLYLGRFP